MNEIKQNEVKQNEVKQDEADKTKVRKKISFAQTINSKIDAVNIDLNLVKNFKKGLLQQMFI